MLQYIPCISLPPAKLRRISWIDGISQLSLMNRLCLGFAFKSASTLQCPNTMLFQLFTAQITAHPTAQCTCHCHWLHPALYFPLLCCPNTAWGRRRRSGGSPPACHRSPPACPPAAHRPLPAAQSAKVKEGLSTLEGSIIPPHGFSFPEMNTVQGFLIIWRNKDISVGGGKSYIKKLRISLQNYCRV